VPVNGLIANWTPLHVRLAIDNLGDSVLQSLWTPDAVNVNYFQIECSAVPTGGGTWHVLVKEVNAYGPSYLNLPFGGLSYSGSGTSCSCDLYFNNWKLYATHDAKWHVFWDSLDVYVNGSLANTFAGNEVVSDALGPSWVPIFAGMVQISGTGPGDGGSAIVSGGWQYKVGSSWYAPPIAGMPPEADAPTSGPGYYLTRPPTPGIFTAPFGLTSGGVVIGSSTYGNQLSISVASGNPSYNKSGTIVLIPNLGKSINRLNPDYGATFWRYAVPQVQGLSTRLFSEVKVPPSTGWNASSSASANVVSRAGAGSYEVSYAPSPIESQFSLPSYCIGSINYSELLVITEIDGVIIASNEEVLNTTYPKTMDSVTGAEDWSSGAYSVAPYMSHADIRCNYFNSCVCHPHWSIGYYTGPWDLESSSTTWEDYWGNIREQFMSAQGRRNHIASCPLETSGFIPFLDTYFQSPTGYGMRWIGVSRWQTDVVNPLGDLTPDSSSYPNWSVPDSSCTLAFGSTITVTPSSSVCSFRLALESFDYSPFMYAQICKYVYLNWPLTNISQVQVYVVSSDGSTQQLLAVNPTDTVTTVNHTYNFPQFTDSKYAGSWAIDNGYGVVSDTGTDFAAGGNSATIMSSPKTVVGFEMGFGRQGAYLLYVVTPTSSSSTFQVNYPKFIAATDKLLLQENGQIANVLYKNGPSIRMGNHIWYLGGWNDPPIVTGLGYKGTVIDWLADKRGLFLGATPLGGTPTLTTECTQLYDAYEGQSIAQVDDNSNYFLLPADTLNPNESTYRSALVNSWSEVPPMAGYPNFTRSQSTWLNTSALCQSSWSWAQVPRRLVSSATRADLYAPDSTTLLSTISSLYIEGWHITESSPIITNNESPNYWIITTVTGKIKWANVTPWHGWFSLLTKGADLSNIDYDVSLQFRHGRAYGNPATGTIWSGYASNANPYIWNDTDTGITANSVAIRWQDHGNVPLGIMYVPTGTSNILWVQTPDEGSTFTMPTTISSTLATNGFFDFEESADFLRWFWWLEGSSAPYVIYVKALDPQLNTIIPRTATNVTNSDLAEIRIKEYPQTGGSRRFGLQYSVSGSVVFLTSPNGITWT
jgi:hypothetical protein